MADKFEDIALGLFVQETVEALLELETGILTLETNPSDSSVIDDIFRHVHTVKGGAGMVMWAELHDYAHHLEDLLSKIRSGELAVTSELVSLLLESVDCIQSFVSNTNGDAGIDTILIEQNQKRIRNYRILSKEDADSVSLMATGEAGQSEYREEAPDGVAGTQSFFIHLRFGSNTFEKGVDPITILTDLGNLGATTIIPHMGDVPELGELDPRKLFLWWTIRLITRQPQERIEEVLMFFLEENEARIIPISAPPSETEEMKERVLRQAPSRSLDKGSASESPPSDCGLPAEEETSSGAVSIRKDSPSDGFVEGSGGTQREEKGKSLGPSKNAASIRVDTLKLDKLQNLVGEVVINQSRLLQVKENMEEVSGNTRELFLQIIDDNERIVRELQEQIVSVRMVPLGNTFAPLQRLVRDFSAASGKKIQLRVLGEETEIDKTLTEQLSGPLTHLVRNAMDHGIESADIRKLLGKPALGTIALRAYHQEGFVVIEVQDDGAGIDTQKVMSIARERGLRKDGDILSEQEIFHLVFNPGLSTAETVTEVSGRGVGMDAVKQGIDALRGTVGIKSQVNHGTTFQIKLPLTLAIIEGMLVKIGNHVFTIPLLSIVESFRPGSSQVKTIQQEGEVIEVREEFIPLLRLYRMLHIEPDHEDPSRALVVIVEHVGRKYCLLVDDVIDQQQVVIKSLEENFIQLPGLAGATILGDGQISLILDVPGIVEQKQAILLGESLDY